MAGSVGMGWLERVVGAVLGMLEDVSGFGVGMGKLSLQVWGMLDVWVDERSEERLDQFGVFWGVG